MIRGKKATYRRTRLSKKQYKEEMETLKKVRKNLVGAILDASSCVWDIDEVMKDLKNVYEKGESHAKI